MEPQVRFCTTPEGVRIAYSSIGQGPPLVIANGCWLSMAHELDDRHGGGFYRALSQHHTLVYYDRRGTGLSDRKRTDFTLEPDVRDLEALADHLECQNFALFGNCALGFAAIAYAARHPERLSHLVLYAAWAHGPSLTRDDIKTTFLTMARSHWGLASRTIADMLLPEAEGETVERVAQEMRESCDSEVGANFLEMIYTEDVTSLLPQVKVPTLVMNRQEDRGVPFRMARELASGLPNARLVPLEGKIYMLWYGDTRPVLEAVQRFLQEETQGQPAPLPSGTAIILFADIADSTGLTERLGDAAFRVKARELDGALRAAIRERGGAAIEGKLLGDGVLAVFTSAREGIGAALACGEAGAGAGLPLHLGIHAGDVIREEGNVYGGAVNIASRVAGLSAPGEVLVSETVRSLARTSAGVGFEDRGEQELKGVGEPVRVWAVVANQQTGKPADQE